MEDILSQLENSFTRFGEKIIQHTPAILIGLVLLVAFIFLASGLRTLTRNRLKRRIKDVLLVNFISRLVFTLVVIAGTVIFLNQLGLVAAAGGILAGAGVSAIIIGFAFKDIGENFLAGFFLAFSRPFRIGDIIEVENLKGVVKALNFRNTHIRTIDGKDIFLPNALVIKNPLINYTRDGLLRHAFGIGLDYGDDITAAGKCILSVLATELRIEHTEPLKPFIMIESFGTSTINLQICYWVNEVRYSGNIDLLRTDVMNAVVSRLIEQGFNLPADIIELKIYQEGRPIPIHINP